MKLSKLLAALAAVTLLSHSAVVLSGNKKIEYKCYFALTDGQQVVRYISSSAGNGRSLAAKMQGKVIFAKDGITRRTVSQVFECVGARESFKQDEAQKLDKQTLS